MVEQTIGDLKKNKVMEGNKISSVVEKTDELDCVIGLHNLRVLRELIENYDIPARRNHIPGEHVFRPKIPENEVVLKIPDPIPAKMEASIKHIRKFEEFMPSVAPALRKQNLWKMVPPYNWVLVAFQILY